jgi:hypothetical protein
MMRRRIAAAAVGGVLLVALGGFVVVRAVSARSAASLAALAAKPTTCTDAYRLLKLRPSQVTAASPVCLSQALQFSGEVVGSVGQAYTVSSDTVAPSSMCSEPKRWDNFPQALIAVVVAGKAYRLRIAAPGASEHQPVAISNAAGMVELASISNPSIDWNQARGTLNLNSDGITGSIDVDVRRDISGARPVHIAGQWACGAPIPLPAFDASAPCANFYALNHLHQEDIARMKASACNPDDLTFSGDLVGHVDHSVTDTSIPKFVGIGNDGACGDGANGDFYASLKFTTGDESFLLFFHTSAPSYGQPVGPGQYSVQGESGSGMALVLGHADPDFQGVFVEDGQVYWMGSGGSFTIEPDLKSGTVDADLTAQTSGSTVHVKGSWRCAA